MASLRQSRCECAAGREIVVACMIRSYTELAEVSLNMRCALTSCILFVSLATWSAAADRHSWNKIRYMGGTVKAKMNPYEWNTTLTVNSDSIMMVFAPSRAFQPSQTVRLRPSQITSLSYGLGAWRRVSEVSGAVMPPKPKSLFGILPDYVSVGIIFQDDNGKAGGVLLETYVGSVILQALKEVTGKPVDGSP
jgi:hypothetical protein